VSEAEALDPSDVPCQEDEGDVESKAGEFVGIHMVKVMEVWQEASFDPSGGTAWALEAADLSGLGD